MPEKAPEPIQIFKTTLKFKDVFDAQGLYTLMHAWLTERGWVDPDTNSPDNHEVSYLEKVTSSGAKIHMIVWQFHKLPEKSKFFKWILKMNINTSDLATVEIMHQGKKIKANKGGIDIIIDAKMQIDYMAVWANHPFLALFRIFFEKKIYKGEIDRMKNGLFGEMTELQARIKQYLELKQFVSTADIRGFVPSGVYRG
ncbi:hypothetical protein HY639_05835 [Candidatus Woesearchaeota archaeon]|nr:hypothetical protein [Candidatus Woesearchaeota archaeon]